jgi:hypothetical protein
MISNSSGTVGSKVGIQFGRADGFGGLGVSTTGALMQAATEVATVGTGIDITGGGSLTITGNAWASPGGAVITGAGQFSSTAGPSTGFFATGAHSGAGFQDSSTTPIGMALTGTYATASLYATSKPDFHYAPTVSTCSQVGQLPVFINGVAKNLMYC